MADNPIELRSFETMMPLTPNQYINKERIERKHGMKQNWEISNFQVVFHEMVYTMTHNRLREKEKLMKMPIVCHYLFIIKWNIKLMSYFLI